MTFFSSLLKELGDELGINLSPDSKGNCIVTFNGTINVHIKPSRNDKILVASIVGDVPPGAFRTRILQAALMSNALPAPSYGVFGYSEDTNNLILFGYIPSAGLTGKILYDYLRRFILKLNTWSRTLKSGEIPAIVTNSKR